MLLYLFVFPHKFLFVHFRLYSIQNSKLQLSWQILGSLSEFCNFLAVIGGCVGST